MAIRSAARIIEDRRARRKAKAETGKFSNSENAKKFSANTSTVSLPGGGYAGLGAGPSINRSSSAVPKTPKVSTPTPTVSSAPKTSPPSPKASGATSVAKAPAPPKTSKPSKPAGTGTALVTRPAVSQGYHTAKAVGAGAILGAAAMSLRGSSKAPKTNNIMSGKGTSGDMNILNRTARSGRTNLLSALRGVGTSSDAEIMGRTANFKPPLNAGSIPLRLGPGKTLNSGSVPLRLGPGPTIKTTSPAAKLPPAPKGAQGTGGAQPTPKATKAPKPPKPQTIPELAKAATITTQQEPKIKSGITATAPATTAGKSLEKGYMALSPEQQKKTTKFIGGKPIPPQAADNTVASPKTSGNTDLQKQVEKARAENAKLKGGKSSVQVAAAKVTPPSSGNTDLQKQVEKARAENAKLKGKATADNIIKETSESPKSNRPPLRKGAGAAKRAAAASANVATPAPAPVAPSPAATIAKADPGSTALQDAAKRVQASNTTAAAVAPAAKKTKLRGQTTKVRKDSVQKAPTPTTTKVTTPSTTSRVNLNEVEAIKARKALIDKAIKEKGVTVETKTGKAKHIAGSTAAKKMAEARKAGKPGLGITGRASAPTPTPRPVAAAPPVELSASNLFSNNPKDILRAGNNALRGLGRLAGNKALALFNIYEGAKELQSEFAEQRRRREAAKKAGTGNVYFPEQRT